MELKNIIKSLRSEIQFEKSAGNDLDSINWGNQDGILISVSDLEKLIDASENTLHIANINKCYDKGDMLAVAEGYDSDWQSFDSWLEEYDSPL